MKTNHIDRLDPALMRPGRIDRKIEYKLASRRQAHGLFMKFFPKLNLKSEDLSSNHPEAKEHPKVSELAEEFARAIPENTFSMAELQGYLLDWKQDPSGAIHGIGAWAENERIAQQERAAREQLRREKAAAAKPQQHDTAYGPMIAGAQSGGVINSGSQSKLASPPITSSEKTSSDVDSEDETQISDTENAYQARSASLGPSKVAKVSPQSETPIVASDVVVS
jgi:mitochondrial chaperone BCS1